jgi:hypothetical protein
LFKVECWNTLAIQSGWSISVKDALGHGSNPRGAAIKDRQAQRQGLFGRVETAVHSIPAGHSPDLSTNARAVQTLMGNLQSTMAPKFGPERPVIKGHDGK